MVYVGNLSVIIKYVIKNLSFESVLSKMVYYGVLPLMFLGSIWIISDKSESLLAVFTEQKPSLVLSACVLILSILVAYEYMNFSKIKALIDTEKINIKSHLPLKIPFRLRGYLINKWSLFYKECVYHLRSPRHLLGFMLYLAILLFLSLKESRFQNNYFYQYTLIPFFGSLFLNPFADNYFMFDGIAVRKYFLTPVKLKNLILVKNLYLLCIGLLYLLPVYVYFSINKNVHPAFNEYILITNNYVLSASLIIITGNYISVFFGRSIEFRDLTGSVVSFAALPFTFLKISCIFLLLLYMTWSFNHQMGWYAAQVCALYVVIYLLFRQTIQYTTTVLTRRREKILNEYSC